MVERTGTTLRLGNYESSLSEKVNQVGIDSSLDNSFGPLLAANIVNAHDELPQRECLLFLDTFHGMKISQCACRCYHPH